MCCLVNPLKESIQRERECVCRESEKKVIKESGKCILRYYAYLHLNSVTLKVVGSDCAPFFFVTFRFVLPDSLMLLLLQLLHSFPINLFVHPKFKTKL